MYNKDFIENSSIGIITKWGHNFHQECLKNKYIIRPKYSDRNYLFLDQENEMAIKILTISEILFEYIPKEIYIKQKIVI